MLIGYVLHILGMQHMKFTLATRGLNLKHDIEVIQTMRKNLDEEIMYRICVWIFVNSWITFENM